MTAWQKPRAFEQGSEVPRGTVRVSYNGGAIWSDALESPYVDWASVTHYRLPATADGRREADRIRKANYRAELGKTLVLPLPPAIERGLERLQASAQVDDPRELLSTLIERLAEHADSPAVAALCNRDSPKVDVSHLMHLIGEDVPENNLYSEDNPA